MPANSFLHIWSSLNLPLVNFDSKEETESKVSWMDVWRRINQENQSTGKLVNLRVPSPLQRKLEKENSLDVIHSDLGNQKTSRRKHKNIHHVTVPDILSLQVNDCRKSHPDDSFEGWFHKNLDSNSIFDEKFLQIDPEFDDGRKLDWIPTVKPWTEEELKKLKELNKSVILEKIKKRSERKKRRKRSQARTNYDWQNKNNVLKLSPKSTRIAPKKPSTAVSPFRPNTPSKVITTGQQYYETKLAELYLIQLGIKR